MTYPPEPWRLRGRMYVSVWALRRAELPRLPEGLARVFRPVTLAGRGLVGAAWVVYKPGGPLHYRELLSALLVRAGLRPRVSITHIWVDSVASRDGGRELWGIPKELAELEIGDDGPTTGTVVEGVIASARTPTGPIAGALIRTGRRLPGRWLVRFRVAQLLGGRLRTTRVGCRTTVGTAAATWDIDPAGALAHLAGRRPLFTLALPHFRMVFGSAAPASDGSAPGG
ncbi:acetoacetate decarboxylase family protein [Plantactinospora sp. B24E8]|uniref:acetoacetate decarboxylase family protein n=1 Tax=Plantactinospora sp. B24E8 TaxID=3153567 RepID=UPI00325F889B